MADRAPVTRGHALVISRVHREDLWDLTPDEWADLQDALRKTKDYLGVRYPCDGFNVGINAGKAAGQTVFHFHVHVIPRYFGDVEDPRGGVRNLMRPLVELVPE